MNNTAYVHIHVFVFLRLVYPKLPVSLDCPFLIAPPVFSYVYLQHIHVYTIQQEDMDVKQIYT